MAGSRQHVQEQCDDEETPSILMRCIDAQYLLTPFYGRLRMTAHLRRLGYAVNGKRVQRLLQLMGLQAIYPKRRTTLGSTGHRIYPYLLCGFEIVRRNQVWSTDGISRRSALP